MIDMHTHAIANDPEAYPFKPLGGERSGWSRTRPVTAEQLIEQMDGAGIERAVLVQASTAYGFDNRYAADSLERHPDRFVGVASIDFLAPDAVDTARQWIDGRGFSGLRIRAAHGTTKVATPGTGLDDPAIDPMWEYLQDARVPVCVQMHASQTPSLLAVLRRYPRLVVALDHAARPNLDGGPPYAAAGELFALAEFPDVYLKITSVTLLRAAAEPGGDPAALVRRLVDGFGAERVTWGSNFPASEGSLRDLRAMAQDAFSALSAEERRQVERESAPRIYPELAATAAAPPR